MAVINAWLLYRRDFAACANPNKVKCLSLYEFKSSVANSLRIQTNPLVRPPGRPATSLSTAEARRLHNMNRIDTRNTVLPQPEVVTDMVGHFPDVRKTRGICALKGCKGAVVFYCIKCKVHLCISNKRNCFATFHGVDLPSE